MCVETFTTGLIFLRWAIWGVTYLGLLSKWMFSNLSPWKSHKCVLKHLQQGTFFRDEQFEDHMPRSTLKMNVFQSISLETHKCVLKHQNRAHFAETINLRGHMPRFTLKMNVFPSISLETHKCVLKHSEQGSIVWDYRFDTSTGLFLRWLIWGVTCLGLL